MRASNAAQRGCPGLWLTSCFLVALLCLLPATDASAGQIYALAYHPAAPVGGVVPIRVDLSQVDPGEGSVLWPGTGAANALYRTMVQVRDWLRDNGCPELADNDVHFQLGERSLLRQDGASAGLALLCALKAECRGVPVPRDIGITGALNEDRVAPVGRIAAKLAAAKEAGLREVIIPSDNQLEAEPLYGESGSPRLVPVSTVQEAFDFLGMSSAAAPSTPATTGGGAGGGSPAEDWSALAVVGTANAVLALALLWAVARRRRAASARATSTTTLLYPRRARVRRNR